MEIISNIIYYIVPFIVLLGILVFVHEFGHFIVARSLGVGVSAFSIGFGKELWSRTDKYGTRWKICAVPLGGYCQFLGDADASSTTESDLSALSEEEKKKSFPVQKSWKKLAIVIAGPLFNYLFAILVFIGVFYFVGKIVYPSVVGSVVPGEAADKAGIKAGDVILSINDRETPDFQAIGNEVNLATEDHISVKISRPLTFNTQASEIDVPACGNGKIEKKKILGVVSLRISHNPNNAEEMPLPPIIGKVMPQSAADIAGMKRGDKLVSVNDVQINSFTDLKDYVEKHTDEPLEIKVERVMNVIAEPKEIQDNGHKTDGRRFLGVMSGPGIVVKDDDLGFWGAVEEGFAETWNLTTTTLRAVGQMITGQRGGKDVGGIIRIAEMSGDISKSGGLVSFIYFMALLSVNLGLINLLPIPVLDGGHVVIFLCELVIGRELKPQVKDYIFKFGLLIILAIMILATWNDVAHLISRWFD